MKKLSINIWMITTFILLGVLIFAAGTFFPSLFVKKTENPQVKITQEIPKVTLEISKAQNPTPTEEEESDLLQIQKAFSKKYNRPLAEVEVTISKKDDTHISGGVKFDGEMGGGWFLAYKGVDGWVVVQDGNGTISCEIVDPYHFPKTMVPECVDENGNLVK